LRRLRRSLELSRANLETQSVQQTDMTSPVTNSSLRRSSRRRILAAASGIVSVVLGFSCTDTIGIPGDVQATALEFFVSNPVYVPSVASIENTSAYTSAPLVYLSLPPGSLPGIESIKIENITRQVPTTLVDLVHGGFDPVGIEAMAGDSLQLTLSSPDGSDRVSYVKVSTKRAPSIVRSNPPKGQTDVALNVIIEAIFTEPVVPQSVTATSFRLLHGGLSVAGRVAIVDGSYRAQFIPDKPLDPNSTYEIAIAGTIRDYDGDALVGGYDATFVTGDTCDASNTACGTSAPSGDYVITGSVVDITESDSVAVPYARITAVVDEMASTAREFQADSLGRYSISFPTRQSVRLYAEADRMDQHCGVVTPAAAQHEKQTIELVQSGIPKTPRGQPTVGGVIYMGPHLGIPGARVTFESARGVMAASATSSVDGLLQVCRLPKLVTVTITKSGFLTVAWPPVKDLVPGVTFYQRLESSD
jgi:hypothetical protein